MLIDLSCPAEALRISLPSGDHPECTLLLYNLTDRAIVSCAVTLHLYDRSGHETGRAVHRGMNLDGRGHSSFPMSVPPEDLSAAVRAETVIDKVWFEDGEIWFRDDSRCREIPSNILPPSPELSDLKYIAGENAVGYPVQLDGAWLCVCGRANSDSETFCARCRCQKGFIFDQYDRARVSERVFLRERQLDLKTRSAREESFRIRSLQEETPELRARRSVRRRTLILIAAALLLCALVYCFFLMSRQEASSPEAASSPGVTEETPAAVSSGFPEDMTAAKGGFSA